MAPKNRKQKADLKSLQAARMVNVKNRRILRKQRDLKPKIGKSSGYSDEKTVSSTTKSSAQYATLDVQSHLARIRRRRWEKEQEKKSRFQMKRKLALLSRILKKKKDSVPNQSIPSRNIPIYLSPEKVLATKRQGRLSDVGFDRMRRLIEIRQTRRLLCKRSLESTRKKFERIIKYIITEEGDVLLENLEEVLLERRRRMGLQGDEAKQVTFSVDKGHGRVLATISFPYHKKSCSVLNQLPVQSWIGADTYEEMRKRGLNRIVEKLIYMGYKVYLGGDLSFLTSSFGLSCGMSYPCFFCDKRFPRGKKEEEPPIDFKVYNSRNSIEVEVDIQKQKFVHRKPPLFCIDLDNVIPPVLHTKIKIGNVLFARLLEIGQKFPKFMSTLKECKLDINRKEQGIVYDLLAGNDVKKLCSSIKVLENVTEDYNYQNIMHSLKIFNEWSSQVSNPHKHLGLEQINSLCCKDLHDSSKECCLTARMCNNLSEIGGFGRSGLIHLVLMHMGRFVHRHRMIGAVSEEGLESLHSRLTFEMRRHRRKMIDKLMLAMKWHTIDVFLCDAEKFSEN